MHAMNRRFTILSPEFAVGPKANPMTLRMIKMLGYASVINVCDQERGARGTSTSQGMLNHVHENTTYRQFAVDNVDDIDESEVQRFLAILNDIPKPVFVCSENGLRATAMWAASMMDKENWQDIQAAASRAGHDVSFLKLTKPKAAKGSISSAAIATS